MSLRICCLTLLLASSLSAATSKLPSLTVGPVTYSDVTVLGANITDLYFTHSKGIANVKLRNLKPELQQTFGFDPKAAAAAEKTQAENDSLYHNTLASDVAAQVAKDARAAAEEQRPLSAKENIVDPVSDKSQLGKPAPALALGKWLTEKPDMEGKYVLVAFWAPWSYPSRNSIPELNALQKKFKDKVVVIGVASESESTVTETSVPKLEFASALDPEGKLRAAAGVTCVPSVLLVAPEGTLLYAGHPGALNEKKLQALMAKPAE